MCVILFGYSLVVGKETERIWKDLREEKQEYDQNIFNFIKKTVKIQILN